MRSLAEAWGKARGLTATWAGSRICRALVVAAALIAVGAFAWYVAPEENRLFYVVLGLGAFAALVPVVGFAYRFVFVRGPHVRIGFGPDLQRAIEVRPEWVADNEMSQPVALQISAANAGDKTAGSFLYNLLLPDAVKDAMSTFFMGGIHPDRHPPEGSIRFIYGGERLPAGVCNTQEIKVRFPRRSETYKCECRYVIHVGDDPAREGTLEITVVDESRKNEGNP